MFLLILFAVTIMHKTAEAFDHDLVSSKCFIDKTDLLGEFFEEDRDVDHLNNYIACPPGFGKTTNLKMIQKFSEIEFDEKGNQKHWKDTQAYQLFKKLKISQNESIVSEHLARHPVLFFDLSFNFSRDTNPDSILSILNSRLLNSFKKYMPRLMNYSKTTNCTSNGSFSTLLSEVNELKMDQENMPQFLHDLCQALYSNFNQTPVIILVDEFDYITNQGMSSLEILNQIYELLHKMFAQVLKSSSHTIYAMTTGSTTIAFRHYCFAEFSQIHYFSEYSAFTPFFGFFQDELTSLYDKYDCDHIERHYVSKYYAGYKTIDCKVSRYNCYSISEYLKQRTNTTLQFPTIQYGGPFRQTFIRSFLKDPQYLDKVAKLLKNCPIKDLFKHKYDYKAVKSFDSFMRHDFGNTELPFRNILYTFTIEQGFFAPVSENIYTIPNYDIRSRFITYLRYNYEQRLRIDLKQISRCIRYILESPQDQPQNLIRDLTQSLNSAFEKFWPFKESGSSLDFTHQLLIDVAALTYEGLHLVDDYPPLVSYNETKFNINKRCVSVVTFGNTAAVVKITYNQPLKAALLRATSYSYKDESINRIRYIAVDIPYRNFTRIFMATLNATDLNDETR